MKDRSNMATPITVGSGYVAIPYRTIIQWSSKGGPLDNGDTYIACLNNSVNYFQVTDPNCRLEERLRKVHSSVTNTIRRSKGSHERQRLLGKAYHLQIEANELKNISDLITDNQKLESKCETLYKNLAEIKLENKNVQHKNKVTKQEVDALRKYINILQGKILPNGRKLHEVNFENPGATDVGPRQKQRQLIQVKTNIDKALWFLESYNLEIDFFQVRDKTDKSKTYTLGHTASPGKAYGDLNDAEKEKLQAILYTMDQYCIGDKAYHELSMNIDGMPRSYLIGQCRRDVNKLFHLERTPGCCPGVQVNVKQELQEAIAEAGLEPDVVPLVKVSGDGAKASRLSHFTTISISIVQDPEAKVYPLAIVKTPEDYETLSVSCSNVFGEINQLVEAGSIQIDDQTRPLEFCLTADMKFLLIVRGRTGATSKFSCIWCYIRKDERHDFTKDKDYYVSQNMARTYDKELNDCQSESYGCRHPPLLKIPVSNTIIDELHLMLRIVDVLLDNCLLHVCDRDKKLGFQNKNFKTKSRDSFVESVRSCGVSFEVWDKPGEPGNLTFTALMGDEKKKILKNLPQKFPDFIDEDHCSDVQQVWQKFADIYFNVLCNTSPTEHDVQSYFDTAVDWLKTFCSLGGKLPGFEKSKVTPYMHCLVYHVHTVLERFGWIAQFTCQHTEKKNDQIRRAHLLKSSHYDSCQEVMNSCKRMNRLRKKKRKPRKYTHKENDIKRKKPNTVGINITEETKEKMEENKKLKEMSSKELKGKLKELNMNVKGKSHENMVVMVQQLTQ